MSKQQAPKGGCNGVNGQFYTGGQFLPSSELTIKGQMVIKSKPKGKVQIENGVWVERKEGYMPLFPRIAGTIAILNHATGEMILNNLNWAYMGITKEEAQKMVDEYNNGARWVPAAT